MLGSLSPFIQPRTPALGWCEPHSGWAFPSQLSLSGNLSQLCPELCCLCDSKPVRLVEINYHTHTGDSCPCHCSGEHVTGDVLLNCFPDGDPDSHHAAEAISMPLCLSALPCYFRCRACPTYSHNFFLGVCISNAFANRFKLVIFQLLS